MALNIADKYKNLLYIDSYPKNFRVHFADASLPDLTNPQITKESVKFSEPLCSSDDLKLGLIEAPKIEFEAIGVEQDITGKIIECYEELDLKDGGRTKTAGTTAEVGGELQTSFSGINNLIVEGYEITVPKGIGFSLVASFAPHLTAYEIPTTIEKTIATIEAGDERTEFVPLSFFTTENPILIYRDIETTPEYEGNDPTAKAVTFDKEISVHKENGKLVARFAIPYGRFIVDSCKRTTNGNIRKVVAYSYLTKNNGGWVSYPWIYHAFTKGVYPKVNYNPIILDASAFRALADASTYEGTEAYSGTVDTEEITQTIGSDTVLVRFISTNSFPMGGIHFTGKNESYCVKCSPMSGEWSNLLRLNGFDEILSEILPSITSFGNKYYLEYLEDYPIFNDVYATQPEEEIPAYTYKIPFYMEATIDGVTRRFGTPDNVGVIPRIYAGLKVFMSSTGYTLPTSEKTINGTRYVQINIDPKEMQKRTLDAIELEGKIGKIDRKGIIRLINISDNFGDLYPSELLYPSESLYPSGGNGGNITKSQYISCEYEEHKTKAFGRVQFVYKDLNNSNVETLATLDLKADYEANPENYLVYDASENDYIKTNPISEATANTYLQNLADGLERVQYTPIVCDMVGRPDLESGDVVQIATRDASLTSIILNRTLKGIGSLDDEITAK